MNRRRSDAYSRQCQEHLKFEQCNGRKPESLMRCWRQGADLANLHQSAVVRDSATCHNDGVKPPLVKPKTHALLSNRRYRRGAKQASTSRSPHGRSGARSQGDAEEHHQPHDAHHPRHPARLLPSPPPIHGAKRSALMKHLEIEEPVCCDQDHTNQGFLSEMK